MSVEDADTEFFILTESVLSPYKQNQNTGNVYEIAVILFLLRKMGLSNLVIDSCSELFSQIKIANAKKASEIEKAIQTTRNSPVGTGLIIDEKHILYMRNVTQDDSDGKTGDLILMTVDGQEFAVSVCEGKPKRGGTIEKCLTNPSARRFGVKDDSIQRFSLRQQQAVEEYKKFFSEKYGSDEQKWPNRLATPAATSACTDVARWTAEEFAKLSDDEKKKICQDLLRINDSTQIPADFLALVNKDTLIPSFYKFNQPIFNIWQPSIVSEGIYLNIINDKKTIGKVQVKFNNGVYHKGKTSSIHSSWNITCNLTDIFAVSAVRLQTPQPC
jgi:hypothetical protein